MTVKKLLQKKAVGPKFDFLEVIYWKLLEMAFFFFQYFLGVEKHGFFGGKYRALLEML